MIKVLLFGGSSFLGQKIIETLKVDQNILINATYNRNYKKIRKYNNIKFYKINFLEIKKSLNKSLKIIKKFDPEFIIFCSALKSKRKNVENISLNELNEIFIVNFIFYFLLIGLIAKKTKKNYSIISLLSSSIFSGGNKISAYTASKASMLSLSKSLKNENKRINFKNLIFPTLSKNKNTLDPYKVSYSKIVKTISSIIKNKKLIKKDKFIIKK